MAVIAIDFDSTLVDTQLPPKPLPGAKEAINTLREKGHKIVIHSANRKAWIEQVLTDYDLRFDKIWEGKGKPNCDIFVDDKGYHFPYNGDWHEELPKVLARVDGLDNRKW